jgi:hypothetical protein
LILIPASVLAASSCPGGIGWALRSIGVARLFLAYHSAMRPSLIWFLLLSLLSGLAALSLVEARLRVAGENARLQSAAALVSTLELTDLALFTEARYTRHPSQADLASAFQDHPAALEHFPSGSIVPVVVPFSRSELGR